jgi:hypothetical protein
MNSKSAIPQLKTIDVYKIYDLKEFKWIFDNTNESIKHNSPIIASLVKDFSDYSGISESEVNKAFDIDHIYTRAVENLMIIYTDKGSEDVHYYLTNINTESYKKLQS